MGKKWKINVVQISVSIFEVHLFWSIFEKWMSNNIMYILYLLNSWEKGAKALNGTVGPGSQIVWIFVDRVLALR